LVGPKLLSREGGEQSQDQCEASLIRKLPAGYAEVPGSSGAGANAIGRHQCFDTRFDFEWNGPVDLSWEPDRSL
jgi:hypothetical protein